MQTERKKLVAVKQTNLNMVKIQEENLLASPSSRITLNRQISSPMSHIKVDS